MRIGVPTELKPDEHRVGMRPAGVEVLTGRGREVIVERGAGIGSGLADERFAEAGATVVETADEVWQRCDLIVKVMEPQPVEYDRMREGQIVFTSFHFAADRELTERALHNRITAVAYETLTAPGPMGGRTRPLHTPMSEIAGRLAAQQGAKYLEKSSGGSGVLLGGVPGVEPGNVLVIGAGVVGQNAARIAYGMGGHVVLMDNDNEQMRRLGEVMPRQLITVFADPESIRHYLGWADLVVGAVLVPGAAAPKLVRREDLGLMKRGSVIVDVAVDQGGCVETCRATTHEDPTFVVDGVIHYCVANMPGAVPRTSTFALTNATLPYAKQLAASGAARALADSEPLRGAANAIAGQLTNEAVAQAFDVSWTPPLEALAAAN